MGRSPFECDVQGNSRQWLPDADFGDCFAMELADGQNQALPVAVAAFQSMPGWAKPLMGIRNLAVLPFGLKTRAPSGTQTVGLFPLIAQTEKQVVMGLDDRHLDFRIVLDLVSNEKNKPMALATTLVRTHNLLGRSYLASIKPFHRLIVPAMLARAAAQ